VKFLAICTSGEWQIPVITAAKKQGILTIAIDSNELSKGFEIADYKIISNLGDLEFIFSEIRKITKSLIGAVSYCSEAGVSLAQAIMNEFQCSSDNLFDPIVATNKVVQRQVWEKTKVIQPSFEVFKSKELALSNALNRKLPFVIKPADSSGSRGVSVINEFDNIDLEIQNAFIHSKSQSIIIEDFMRGSEFTVEVFAYGGEIKPVIVTKKDKVGRDVLTVSKALWTVNPTHHLYDSIVSSALKAFASLGLKNGPGHLELIVDEEKGPIGIVEAALRGGGFNLSTKLIKASTGFDFTKASLSIFDKSLSKVETQFYKPSILFFYPSQTGQLKSIEGLDEIKRLPDVEIDLLASIGEFYGAPKTDADRLCTIVISAEDENTLIERKKYVESILFFRFG